MHHCFYHYHSCFLYFVFVSIAALAFTFVGWHSQHYCDSPEVGLVLLFLLTPCIPSGGGTILRSGSVGSVARLLASRGTAGIPAADMHAADAKDTSVISGLLRRTWHLREVEFTGAAGDVCICHPMLLHRGSDNLCSLTPRSVNNTPPPCPYTPLFLCLWYSKV